MKRNLLFILLFSVFAQAQYTTPNTGETFTLSNLLLVEPAIVILSDTGEYSLISDLNISSSDTFLIDESITLKISPNVLITIEGNWTTSTEGENILITADDPENPHEGFRFEEGSISNFSKTNFEYGGGFKVLSTDFNMDYCLVKYQTAGASTGAAISFSRGVPVISNTYFYQNQLPAISSGANQSVAVQFIGNTLDANGLSNQNRPQINLGPSGSEGSILIEDNIIVGDRNMDNVGGIAISNFFGSVNNVVIKNNQITDNRYGLTLVGPVSLADIDENTISDNNTQGNPNLGGSGINLNASGETISQSIYIRNNYISNNLWGITMQGNSYANLGDGSELSPGGNTFSENGFDGVVYAFYNNTPNDIMAQGNCWIAGQESSEDEVAEVITDQSDISNLGLVDYSNFTCNLSTTDLVASAEAKLYPNPAKDFVILEIEENAYVEFYNSLGQLVLNQKLTAGKNEIKLKLSSGAYFLKINFKNATSLEKLWIK